LRARLEERFKVRNISRLTDCIKALRQRRRGARSHPDSGALAEPIRHRKIFHAGGNRRGGIGIGCNGKSSRTLELIRPTTTTPPRRGFSLPAGSRHRAQSRLPVASPAAVSSCGRDRAATGSAACCLRSWSRCRGRLSRRAARDPCGRYVLGQAIIFPVLAYLGLLTNGLSHHVHPSKRPASGNTPQPGTGRNFVPVYSLFRRR
jgi:hypothetical protein